MKKIIFLFYLLLVTTIHAQKASIVGKVVEAETNVPIGYANVIVQGTTKGTLTNDLGEFSLINLPTGYIKLEISLLGYKPKITEAILLSNNKTPYVEIELEKTEEQLETVVIKKDVFRKKLESLISVQSLESKEIESNPGSNRDISRVVQSLPGVGSTPAFRNDLIIRGGSPSENKFYLDEIEIPIINHFATQGASGGPVGIINSDFIKNVDFYSASFPAMYDNALSGILDFKLKEGNTKKTNFQFSLGASETALTLDGPLGNRSSYIFSVRRSYLQFLFSAIGLPFLPTFNDYQFKSKTRFNNKNTLSVISIGSYDELKLNTDIDNPDETQEYILSKIPVNNQWSYTFGLVYKNYFDAGNHTFILSRNKLNNQLYKYPDNDESKPKRLDYKASETENKFRYVLSLIKSKVKYKFSANLGYATYTNNTNQQIFNNDSLSVLNYYTKLNIFNYGISAQVSSSFFNQKLLATLGYRTDANNYNAKTKNLLKQSAPRFSLSYNVTENISLNGGAGVYYKQPAYTTLGYRDNSGALVNQNTTKYIGLTQYNLGLSHTFAKPILLAIEGFYKNYFQYPIDIENGISLANQGANFDVAGINTVTFKGKGESYGVEILNRWNFQDFKVLASYTFVRSFFTTIDNKWIPSSWDSKHLLTVTATKELSKNWRTGLKWRFVGGFPYTPYDLETSSDINAWNAKGEPYLDYSKTNSKRLPAFHQLDIRIDKNYFFKKWTLLLYIDIQNVYNFKYKGQDYVIRQKNDDGTYLTNPEGTKYILKNIPNESGTILPTIGVLVKI